MAALFGGLSRRGHSGNRPSTHGPPNGTAGLVADAVVMGTTWVTTVNQSQVQVPSGQGKYCHKFVKQEQASPDGEPGH